MAVFFRIGLLGICVTAVPLAWADVEAAKPAPVSEAPSQLVSLGLVTGNHVNLRAGPGGSYEILSQFQKQTALQILAVEGEWYAVPLPEPVSAYVHRDYLTVEGDGATARGNRVHVRAGPGLGSSSLGFLSSGEKVRVRGMKGEWVEVQPPGFCRGWIHRSYVALLEPAVVSKGESR